MDESTEGAVAFGLDSWGLGFTLSLSGLARSSGAWTCPVHSRWGGPSRAFLEPPHSFEARPGSGTVRSRASADGPVTDSPRSGRMLSAASALAAR